MWIFRCWGKGFVIKLGGLIWRQPLCSSALFCWTCAGHAVLFVFSYLSAATFASGYHDHREWTKLAPAARDIGMSWAASLLF